MTTSEEGRATRRSLSPETLAAQALGAVDPVSGAPRLRGSAGRLVK
jgi:hypothetical protein